MVHPAIVTVYHTKIIITFPSYSNHYAIPSTRIILPVAMPHGGGGFTLTYRLIDLNCLTFLIKIKVVYTLGKNLSVRSALLIVGTHGQHIRFAC
jgi:hypothetical protein